MMLFGFARRNSDFEFKLLLNKITNNVIFVYWNNIDMKKKDLKGIHVIHTSQAFSNIFVYTISSLFPSICVPLCTYGLDIISLSNWCADLLTNNNQALTLCQACARTLKGWNGRYHSCLPGVCCLVRITDLKQKLRYTQKNPTKTYNCKL